MKRNMLLPLLLLSVLVLLAVVSGCDHHNTEAPEADDPSVLSGVSLLFTGDSLTNGHGLTDFNQSWCGMLGTECGMKVTCQSISGSTVSDRDGGFEPMCSRALPVGPFDIVFLECTGNDWTYGIPLGEDYDSRDTSEEIGAINVLIDRVQAAYPDALIVFMTPWNSTGEVNRLGLTIDAYTEMLLELCRRREIPCFHAYEPEISGVDASTPESRARCFLSSRDRWHLNEAAHREFLPIIGDWLSRQYADHLSAA